MKSRRQNTMHKRNKNRTRKYKGGKDKPKKWTTAIQAAQDTLSKTGSLAKAKKALKVQALANARKLFGSIGQNI
jgi:hypothetical protein